MPSARRVSPNTIMSSSSGQCAAAKNHLRRNPVRYPEQWRPSRWETTVESQHQANRGISQQRTVVRKLNDVITRANVVSCTLVILFNNC
ncbi:hypothetical protein ANCCAN_11501 [Ancylostoma caninum]|uniref:Uncharacterized protein n=1 Tax=Ancylostoma caninum TaxID=29170 RepID=A0A368GGZ7_ANCCA|nr:hypothetical protein ANCCAN_11501 [Ancylostoma caninum]